VKRVHQELGGKSVNILLPDADLSAAVPTGIGTLFSNSGQTCSAPSRMFVQRACQAQAVAIAREAARAFVVGDPQSDKTNLGPISNKVQYAKIQDLIGAGIAEGATLVVGGLGRPEGLTQGFYARPSVFADVTPDMRISREEIFGPVLSILPYDTEEDAIRMANDTVYGLAAYVSSADVERARRHGVSQQCRLRHRSSLRRLQAVGQRPRMGGIRSRRISRDQGRGRLSGRLSCG
jgi:aldehyde dehydrogenase (NAD+)